jgi:hypothetical protein
MRTTQYFAMYAQKGIQLLSGSESAFRGSIGANEEDIIFQNNPIYNITNGIVMAHNTDTVQALHDINAATADINSRTRDVEFESLNGQTFAPGLYTYTGGGDLYLDVDETLTLDGGGDRNAVWIFRVSQKMYFHGDMQIINLPGFPGDGNQPVPVWWHVNEAELEFSPTVVGNILSDSNIYVHAGEGVTSVAGSLLVLFYIYIESGAVLSCQAYTYPNSVFGTYEPTATPSQWPSSRPYAAPSAPPSVRSSDAPSIRPSAAPTNIPKIGALLNQF